METKIAMTTRCCHKCFYTECPPKRRQRGGTEPRPICPCHQTHSENKGWEEEFDREFIQDDGVIEEFRPHHLKNFIQSHISHAVEKERQEILEAINKEDKVTWVTNNKEFHNGADFAYNQIEKIIHSRPKI